MARLWRVLMIRAIVAVGKTATPINSHIVNSRIYCYKDKWWVIDIGGNNLRLLAFIEFRDNRMYVKHIVTHADYDKLCKKYAREAD